MEKYLEKACKEYDAERDISGLAGGNYGHYLADILMFDKETQFLEKGNELEEKLEFIKKVKEMGVNPDDVLSQRDIKEKLIKDYKGYTRLSVSGQKYKENEKGEALLDCSDHKIGLAFKNLYYSALKKSKK
jgi:hypothetical protein